LAGFDVQVEFLRVANFREFDKQNYRRAHLEVADFFTLAESDAFFSQVFRFRLIFSVNSVSRCGHLVGVGPERFIKVELDRADIGSTDEADREEAVSPVPNEVDTLVGFEDISVSLKVARINRLEIASYMTSVVCAEISGRVESVVITWRQVDDEVHYLVSSSLSGLELLITYLEAAVRLTTVQKLI